MRKAASVCLTKKVDFSLFFSLFVAQGIHPHALAHTYRMIKPTKNIQDVKQMVKSYDNKRVAVRVNLGRNKSVQFSGVVGGVYPSLFTVRPDKADFLGKTAYSYADVLCGAVSLKPIS